MPTYQLNTPSTVGDLANPITVSQLNVTAISFQFDPSLTGGAVPQMIVSVVLKEPVSGWSHTVTYRGNTEGAAVLKWFSTNFQTNLVTAVLNRLMADGKLPPGTII